MNEMAELQAWFAAHCDGEWEQGDGIEIHTLDNLGWRVAIGLEGTALEDRPFAAVEENYAHDTEWLRCWVEDGQFQGAGGPAQLTRIVQIFLAWARRVDAPGP